MMKLFLILLILTSTAYATDYDVEAINCIVGEASGEGYDGMLAVAESIRNRGSLHGVYGCHASHIKNESSDTFDLAGIAWITSEDDSRTWKANSWGTQEDIDKNHMDKKCTEITRIKRHTFFKC